MMSFIRFSQRMPQWLCVVMGLMSGGAVVDARSTSKDQKNG
jgi:hypothetical protein